MFPKQGNPLMRSVFLIIDSGTCCILLDLMKDVVILARTIV